MYGECKLLPPKHGGYIEENHTGKNMSGQCLGAGPVYMEVVEHVEESKRIPNIYDQVPESGALGCYSMVLSIKGIYKHYQVFYLRKNNDRN